MADFFPDFDAHDAIGLAELVRRRETTPGELLEAAIARIERINPSVNAVIRPLYDRARAAIAKGLPLGPFTGVPFLLKDLGQMLKGERLAGGIFTSLTDLKRKLMRYIRRYNRAPKPVKWLYRNPAHRITTDSPVTVH